MGRRTWIRDTGVDPVFYVRRPSIHYSQWCAGQQISRQVRESQSPAIILHEWEQYVGLLRSNGYRVEVLPSLVTSPYDDVPFTGTLTDRPDICFGQDMEFGRDGMIVTPKRRCVIMNFAAHSAHRNHEAVGFMDHFESGLFSSVGFDSLPEATLLLSGEKKAEGGDVEFFYREGRGWLAVIGLSGRTNRHGVEELVGFFATEGMESVVIRVRERVEKRWEYSMHWTTRGHPFERDGVGLKYRYFSRAERRKLRGAGLNVVPMPEVLCTTEGPNIGRDLEGWSPNYKLAPDKVRRGGHLVAFSHRGHPAHNEWLTKMGVRVIETDMTRYLTEKEGGPDCLVQCIAA